MSDPSSSCLPKLRRFVLFPLSILILTLGSAFSPSRSMSMEMTLLRSEIVGFAQEFVGLRYRYAGRSPETGFDCSGFTRFVLQKFDAAVSSSSSTQSLQGAKIPLEQVMPGDLVFFGRRGRRIQHVAMVVENTPGGIVCVHSTSRRGVVVENVSTSAYWRPRILFARDVLGQHREM
ncbi:MAG: C40 family peptidase [Saprospiraceae bacterium]